MVMASQQSISNSWLHHCAMLTMGFALFDLCMSHPMMIAHPMNTVFCGPTQQSQQRIHASFLQSCHAQVILGWRSLEGGWLQRVVTHRLSTTGSLQTVLSGTDWGLAAVVAGKRWVKQAQAKGAAQDRRAAQSLRKQIGRWLLLICCSHCCGCCCCCCWCQCVERGLVRLNGNLLPTSCLRR